MLCATLSHLHLFHEGVVYVALYVASHVGTVTNLSAAQGSQELNGQNSGIRQQEGAFAEAAAAEGAAEPADLKSAANTVTDEDQNENDEEADEAVNEPGTEDRETLDAAQVWAAC